MLRGGNLTNVSLVKSIGQSFFWVRQAGKVADSGSAYFISKQSDADNLFTLTDASKTDSQPVQLIARDGLRICRSCTYIGTDGKLHVVTVESSEAHLVGSLRWWTIEPSSGQLLLVVRKHTWPDGDRWISKQAIRHPKGRLVIGMVDHHTIAVMHAETLDEIAYCILPQGSSARPLQIAQVEWSSDGRSAHAAKCHGAIFPHRFASRWCTCTGGPHL